MLQFGFGSFEFLNFFRVILLRVSKVFEFLEIFFRAASSQLGS